MYLVKLPKWVRWFYPKRIMSFPTKEKILYLTFDDGPNEDTTTFILQQLAKYNAKATFFCIGKNVDLYPDLFEKIYTAGHSIGNHTQNHLNGWNVSPAEYVKDIESASKRIHSDLFRPPYGRMSKKCETALKQAFPRAKTIMWNVLSGDFDRHISGEKCWQNVKKYAGPGDIIVFHDSDKARERMEYALFKTLEYYSQLGFQFCAIPMENLNKS